MFILVQTMSYIAVSVCVMTICKTFETNITTLHSENELNSKWIFVISAFVSDCLNYSTIFFANFLDLHCNFSLIGYKNRHWKSYSATRLLMTWCQIPISSCLLFSVHCQFGLFICIDWVFKLWKNKTFKSWLLSWTVIQKADAKRNILFISTHI